MQDRNGKEEVDKFKCRHYNSHDEENFLILIIIKKLRNTY